ncbi:MAG: double-cubane-cluster-containing anaerobic reductase [Dehalogenimonas sp.]|uniref:Double-cubane-cluster-containing anaerobic reductase n=1 Tax=Candidatus Dehalogenimonas loeffleri TaxID=3127115 RepID=A0ABZ2J425_9CHLR|nr:double-cubane-cluster-containing anaerobic reductase [Dehalogenimonas sp.]
MTLTANEQMWSELGIDLESHGQLMNALGPIYGEIYLSQKNRPQGMGFYDFVVGDIHGIRVKELREHAKDGGKVVATYCVFVPEEFCWAAGAIPVSLCAGTQFSVPVAEEVLPRNTCALIKSSYGFKLGRLCPYVQVSHLIVGETTCDGKKKMFELLAEQQPVYVMEVPNKRSTAGRALWQQEVRDFKAKIEELTGNEITVENLGEAIKKVNARRREFRRLSALRAADPAPISGKDALLATQVSMYDDVERQTQMITALNDELEERVKKGEGVAPKGAKRILISGSPMAIPNWKLHHIVESSGAIIVGEESCTGSRFYNELIPEGIGNLEDMLTALADRYLKTNCACFTPNTERLDDIIKMARDLKADGIIHYNLQFCHTYANEAVQVDRALAEAGIPLLRVETDYSDEDAGQLKTRIDAFLEML